MAQIDTYLSKILSAIYGKDVRQAIHDSITEINNKVDTLKQQGGQGGINWLDPYNGEVFTSGVNDSVEPDVPDIPDVPVDPNVTLSSISATYTGGNVAVGTAVTNLKGITVIATYSDGSTAPVTGYTLSGAIVEGSNTIIVTYGGMTTTFTVIGEAKNADSGEHPVYLETINGVEYITVLDPTLVGDFLGANSYKNDTYTCYGVNPLGHNGYVDRTVAEPYGGVIPFAEGTDDTGAVLLNYGEDGEYCGGPSKGWVRLYNNFGVYDNVHDYYWGKYGVLTLALKNTLSKKTIDPSLITSISIQQNDDTWQYAQFGYSDCPASNIYGGCNTLTFRAGDNANLSVKNYPCVAMSTSKLSIKFKPNTFADFTLDAVKAYLTEHPLTLIY